MRPRSLLSTAMVILSVLGTAAFAAPHQKLAVLGIEPQDDDAKTQQQTAKLAKVLTDSLRGKVGGATGFDLAPNSNKELTEVKLLNDCLDESPECMKPIGQELKSNVLLYGHLTKKNGTYEVTLTTLNVDTGTKGQTISHVLKPADATEDGMKGNAGNYFNEAVGLNSPNVVNVPPPPPQPEGSTLVVEANVPTGQVTVNGQPAGDLANGTATIKLPPSPTNTYVIGVTSDGYQKWEGQTQEIKPGASGKIKVSLDKNEVKIAPPPPTPEATRPGKTARILFWTTAVITAGGVVAFSITGSQVRSIEKEQDAAIAAWPNGGYMANGVQFPNDACAEASHDGYQKLVDICDRGKSRATLTNVLVGATAVSAVATIFFAYKGYISTGSTEKSASREHESDTVAVTPVIGPQGAGMTAVVQF